MRRQPTRHLRAPRQRSDPHAPRILGRSRQFWMEEVAKAIGGQADQAMLWLMHEARFDEFERVARPKLALWAQFFKVPIRFSPDELRWIFEDIRLRVASAPPPVPQRKPELHTPEPDETLREHDIDVDSATEH